MSGEGHLQSRPLIHAPLEFRMRSGGTQASRAFVLCPKCEAPGFVRRSERITATVKHLHCHCTNTGCGHTWLNELTFVHSFNPGLIDRPDLDLKVCPRDQVPHVMPPEKGEDDSQMSMFTG